MRILLWLLALPLLCSAQDKDERLDSLEQVLKVADEPESIIETTFLLAEHLEYKNPERADSLATLLLANYINPQDSSDLMRVNFIKAASHRWMGKYAIAIDYYLANHSYYSLHKDSMNLAKAGHYVGFLSGYMGKYIRAQKYLLEVADIYAKKGTAYQKADVKASLADIYFSLEQYDKSEAAYLESLAHFNEIQDTSGLSTMHCNLGYLYTETKDYEKAEYHLLEDRKYVDNFHDERDIAFNYDFMGYLRQEQGNYKEAYKEYVAALKIRRQLTSTYNLCESLNSVGSILTDLGRYEEAIAHIEEIFTYEDHESESQELTAHQLLSKAYEGKGAYKSALKHYKIYSEISDSIDAKEKFDILAEKDAAYKKQEQDAQIALLNEEKLIDKAQLIRSRFFLISSILGLLALSGFAYYVYQSRQKIAAKNALISKALDQKELLMKEIHHRVKNNLQMVSSLLKLQSRYIEDKTALEAIQNGRNRVQSMAILHRSLYSEDDLTSVNMKEYCRSLAHSIFQSYKLTEEQVKLNLDIQVKKLDVDSVVPIGLIINELITNSLKHAFTDTQKLQAEISVKLKDYPENYELIVSDNGKGLSNELIQRGGTDESFGQRMIRAFTDKLKAQIEITNHQGAEVRILIPKA